ncbi:hypothetical protein T4C_8505 [Trichinella pseudospiralis]|uniref:CCHC-type domain-containing protein n=1 Tax=Trichinella pseudospiralis TaxID=6337 RepID=A0A0V1K2S5_TRIPS|nr:hypothetical protein T4C_8505 [Trichinella pseudospiralis]
MAAKEPMDSVSHEGREVRLPHFELPKFDGDVTRFREFWDQFEASVHQQTDLCDATKMAYLRSCLTGVALDALQGLSAANQGYETAVQRLKGCFDRPQGVYSLTALGKDPRNGGLSAAEVMIAVVRERLPNSIRIQWDKLTMENQSMVADLPGFLRFLQEQVELADTTRRARDLRLEDKRSENASEKQGSSDTRATFHVYKEKIMKSSKTETAERKAAFEEGKEPCNLRILKWQLTPFDGDIMQFEKFICLRSNLKGPALDVISGFSITATNYPEAVKTLRERFDRADLIIQHHIIQLAEIKKMTEPSPTGLRKLYDKLMLHFRALRAMGKDPINGQLTTAEIFLALTQKAMPSELNKKWEEFVESNTSTPANLESFLEFVRKQIDIEEKVTFTKGTKFTSVEKCATTLHENRSKGRPGKYTTAALQIHTQERTRCLLCQKFHDISACTQFLTSDLDERWRIAKRLGLCHSCLKKGHRKIECRVSRKTATGETTIHDLLNRKDAGDKKIDENPEENTTKV